MEDLQAAIQNVLADPAQMAQLQAMAAALGLQDAAQGTSESAQGSAESTKAADSDGKGAVTAAAGPGAEAQPVPDARLMGLISRLGTLSGSEVRVFSALRPGLSARGREKADRALTAARLSRLAGLLLASGNGSHV